MTTKTIQFLDANAKWPLGQPWSTARLGTKWNESLKPGDVVDLMTTESKRHLGKATVLGTRLTTFQGVIDNALKDRNHAISPGMTQEAAAGALSKDLKAAYGEDIPPTEQFTVVDLMAHSPE